MSLLDDLPHTCSIYGYIYSRDSLGGESMTPVARLTDQPAWFQPASQGEKNAAQQREKNIAWKAYFAEDVDLVPGETVVPDDGPCEGKVLTLISYAEASAGEEVCWKAMLAQEEDKTEP